MTISNYFILVLSEDILHECLNQKFKNIFEIKENNFYDIKRNNLSSEKKEGFFDKPNILNNKYISELSFSLKDPLYDLFKKLFEKITYVDDLIKVNKEKGNNIEADIIFRYKILKE